VMKRAGIIYQMLGKALGKDHTHTDRAIQERLPPEQVGGSYAPSGTHPSDHQSEARDIPRGGQLAGGSRTFGHGPDLPPKSPGLG
jgi:hypothetical protein